jgi:hypothetical protein
VLHFIQLFGKVDMKKFIKENCVLVVGISLPLMVVIFFLLASYLPTIFVENPRYDFLFSRGEYGEVDWVVVNGKLNFKIAGVRHREVPVIPHLYRYSAATGNVQEIVFIPPDLSKQAYRVHTENSVNANVVIPIDPNKPPSDEQIENTHKIINRLNKYAEMASQTIPVSETALLQLSANSKAPDGYEFQASGYRYNGGNLFLVGHSYYREPALIKEGKTLPVMYHASNELYPHTAHFIGWIIP